MVEGDVNNLSNFENNDICGVLIQNPDNFGKIQDYSNIVSNIKSKGILTIQAADILSLVLLKSAGDQGFDVCIGSAQRFGVPMMNGGPHAGFMAVKQELNRRMPGRVVGISIDNAGNPALRLALQTREQHIKRERATSNICTAQALLANMSAFYAIYHGKKGLIDIASRIVSFSSIFSKGIASLGFKVRNNTNEIFDTVVVIDSQASQIVTEFQKRRINLRLIDNNSFGISFNDTTTIVDVEELLSVFSELKKSSLKIDLNTEGDYKTILNKDFVRQSSFLEHDVFNKYSSETQIMRYIYHLQKKDYSLLDGMIPLGSCTLKLNSAAELIPITWAKLAQIHPFSPENQRLGYKQLIEELSEQLKAITQMDHISLQPNSGANGEMAGILSIRRYQESLGQKHRNIVLIPSSAHGTNPATAAICGLKNVVVLSDPNGNIDVKDFKEKAEKHKDNLSCAMITYPSTHGVFEETIKELAEIVHQNGGQLYIDGANMNAQVGHTAPGVLGGDVCHLNLHKTFAIPHGGGGPGVGPICVKKHLAPFVPGHHEFDSKKVNKLYRQKSVFFCIICSIWLCRNPSYFIYVYKDDGNILKRVY